MAKLCGFTFGVQASSFIAYVVTSCSSIASELTQTAAALFFIYVENVQDVVKGMTPTPGLHQCLIIVKFHEFSCLDIFYFSPPILPFVLVYFCFGYFIFRNQVRISHFFSSYVFVPLTYHYEPASSSKGQ
jgi:calcium permeable stress-gated cation channel